MQRGQLRRGVDAQRVGQGLPRALVHQQRLAVAAGGDEGAHQRGDEPFPYRVRGHQVGQLGDQLRAAPEGDLRVGPLLRGGQPQLLEPDDRGVERGAVEQADVLHGRTAPQLECLSQQPRPQGSVLGAGLARANEAFEPRGVDGVGRHPQPVAVRLPLDHSLRQCLPQPGNQALQGVRRIGGRVLPPDPVDERRLGNHAIRPEREGDQQSAQPRARHVGEAAVVSANLQWPEHPDLHPLILPRLDSSVAVRDALG